MVEVPIRQWPNGSIRGLGLFLTNIPYTSTRQQQPPIPYTQTHTKPHSQQLINFNHWKKVTRAVIELSIFTSGYCQHSDSNKLWRDTLLLTSKPPFHQFSNLNFPVRCSKTQCWNCWHTTTASIQSDSQPASKQAIQNSNRGRGKVSVFKGEKSY